MGGAELFRRFHLPALQRFKSYLLDWKPLFSSAACISGAIHTNFSSNCSSRSLISRTSWVVLSPLLPYLVVV